MSKPRSLDLTWLSLYGVPEATAAPLQRGLAELQSALIVPERTKP